MKFLTMRRFTLTTAVAATALILAGCAGGGSGSGDGDAPEKADITIAINPSTQFAPMYYGIESGIFDEHGLSVEVITQADNAAIISGLASGQYDFGFSPTVHVLMANANGIPIRAVSSIEGRLNPDNMEAATATIASEASGVSELADLEGKTVATTGLTSISTLSLFELVDRAGVDVHTLNLVQLPFGQMPAALANGDVDAAILQWPFAKDALDAGGEVVAYNTQELFAGGATTLFNASEQFIDANPNTVQAFSDAMIASIDAASADPEAARHSLIGGMNLTPEQAEEANWNLGGDPRLNIEPFEVSKELIVKFTDDDAVAKAVEALDVSTVIWPGALEE